MKKILTNSLNKIFNESFENKHAKDLINVEDFNSIFIVQDDFTHRKLLQCSVKLSHKIAYCPESLIDQILPVNTKSNGSVEVENAETKPAEEKHKETIETESIPNKEPEGKIVEEKPVEAIDVEETKAEAEVQTNQDEEKKSETIETEETNTNQVEDKTKEINENEVKNAESSEQNPADATTTPKNSGKKAKPAKKASNRKTKKEIVHQPSKDVETLEKEDENDQSNVKQV